MLSSYQIPAHWVFLGLCLASAIRLFQQMPRSQPKDAQIKFQCEPPRYTVRTISYDPLIQHIENFISPTEIKHLLALGQGIYEPSTTVFGNGTTQTDPVRTSSSAFLPREDDVVECIISRAAEYQGFLDVDMIEDLQLTQYLRHQHYGVHYDWLQSENEPEKYPRSTDRDTTFFATLEASCKACGTNFPYLAYNWTTEDPRWCKFVDCDRTDSLTVNPVPGSAVFWKNLLADGKPDFRMMHAGLPVPDGYKTGLNIWSTVDI